MTYNIIAISNSSPATAAAAAAAAPPSHPNSSRGLMSPACPCMLHAAAKDALKRDQMSHRLDSSQSACRHAGRAPHTICTCCVAQEVKPCLMHQMDSGHHTQCDKGRHSLITSLHPSCVDSNDLGCILLDQGASASALHPLHPSGYTPDP